MKRIAWLAASLIAALLLVACGGNGGSSKSDGNGSSNSPERLPTLTVGHVGHDHQIALGLAALEPERMQKACGAHLKELKPREVYQLVAGDKPLAELHIKKVGGGSRMPEAMSQGKIDIGLGGIPAVVFFVDKGHDFKILSPLNVDGDMLVVKPDFPARTWNEFVAAVKQSPTAVKIGYKAPVAVAKLIFEKACEAAGLTCVAAGKGQPGQVELVNLQGLANAVPTLTAGSIDGAVVNEPMGSTVEYKKAGRIVCLLSELPPEGMWRSHPCCCVCATRETVEKHRPALRAFMAMIRAATDIINQDKAFAAEIAQQWTKKPAAVETRSIPNIVYTTTADEAYRRGLDRWFTMMRELDKFQGSLKGLSNEEAFARVHDLSILEEVK